jgi:hypothetical protein
MGTGTFVLVILGLLVIAALSWALWSLLSETPYEGDASVEAVSPASLVQSLRASLSGPAGADGVSPRRVVWTDVGEEVLVHLDSLAIEVGPGLIVASLDLESDQTGRETMRVPFAVGESREKGGMIALTEDLPTGHRGLAARWGSSLQAVLWEGVLAEARARAGMAGGVPGRIWVEGGDILFEASTLPESLGRKPAPAAEVSQ